MKLKNIYKSVYRQGFIPIIVADDYNIEHEVEACVKAGLNVIEYTQRRADIATIIPKIKKQYPELIIIVGSMIDSEKLIISQQKNYQHLKTMAQWSALGVDGFVSMLNFCPETIAKYKNTHLLIPAVYNPNEALSSIDSGAHFVKVVGDWNLLKQLNSAPLFKFVPVAITGGIKLELIDEAVKNGANLIMAGFDLMLKNSENPSVNDMTKILRDYSKQVRYAREKYHPELAELDTLEDWQDWNRVLPHFCPEFSGE